MAYNSPKQIRRRQLNAENKATQPRRQRKSTITVSTDEEWERTCNFSLACLHTQANEGHCDAAGRHAQAIVHMAIYRRALQIMRDFGRAYWKATLMARTELLGKESA